MHLLHCILIVVVSGFSAFAGDDYFPLHVGDEWVMTFKVVPPNGHVFESTFHQKTTGTTDKDGKSYFRCHRWTSGMPKDLDTTKLIR